MSSLAYLHYTLLSIGLYFLNSYIQQRRLPASLPPGPRGLPVIGVSGGFPNRCVTHAWHSTLFSLSSPSSQKQNVADMPTQKDWLTYAKWGKKYGQLIKILLYIFMSTSKNRWTRFCQRNGPTHYHRQRHLHPARTGQKGCSLL